MIYIYIYIYLHLVDFDGINVGKYIVRPMDPIGMVACLLGLRRYRTSQPQDLEHHGNLRVPNATFPPGNSRPY